MLILLIEYSCTFEMAPLVKWLTRQFVALVCKSSILLERPSLKVKPIRLNWFFCFIKFKKGTTLISMPFYSLSIFSSVTLFLPVSFASYNLASAASIQLFIKFSNSLSLFGKLTFFGRFTTPALKVIFDESSNESSSFNLYNFLA